VDKQTHNFSHYHKSDELQLQAHTADNLDKRVSLVCWLVAGLFLTPCCAFPKEWPIKGKGSLCHQRVLVSSKGPCVIKGSLCHQRVLVSSKGPCVIKGSLCHQRVLVSSKGSRLIKNFLKQVGVLEECIKYRNTSYVQFVF